MRVIDFSLRGLAADNRGRAARIFFAGPFDRASIATSLIKRLNMLAAYRRHWEENRDAGWTQSLERLADYAEAVGARGNAGRPENTSAETDRGIVISRVLDAPRELVWEAMSDPLHLVHWWGPHGFTTTIERLDFRAGGVWKQIMHGPDGANYPNKSVFMEIVPPECLVYFHGGGREGGTGVHFVATWTFAALAAGRTQLTVHLECASAADRDLLVREFRAIEGGTQTLEKLGEHLAGSSAVTRAIRS
jgi:uncharacterized protein YndB with AHSA1/START domain